MTLGDSITAAFGLYGAKDGIEEVRGQSWAIGADNNATSVFNFLKYYNPTIIGGSLRQHVVELCYGPLCPPFQYKPDYDVLNAAQSGAMIADLVTHEVDYLVKQVKAHKAIDIKQDWKLLTILIGANDLCASCTIEGKIFLTPEEFENHLMNTLNRVRKELPRTLVQIGEMFNLSQVYNLSLKSDVCKDIHRTLFIECDCIFKPEAAKARAAIDEHTQLYNERSRKVASHFQSLKDPEFTVITQPFARDTALKDFPITALSTLDCFHPSLSTHQAMAVNTWNSMFLPAAKKPTVMDLNAVPVCPTADSRIFTN
jgi:phospholipase B1